MSNFRKLLGHLHTVAEQYEKNLMPVINLAPLWGPNMLIVDGQVGTTVMLSYIYLTTSGHYFFNGKNVDTSSSPLIFFNHLGHLTLPFIQ